MLASEFPETRVEDLLVRMAQTEGAVREGHIAELMRLVTPWVENEVRRCARRWKIVYERWDRTAGVLSSVYTRILSWLRKAPPSCAEHLRLGIRQSVTFVLSDAAKYIRAQKRAPAKEQSPCSCPEIMTDSSSPPDLLCEADRHRRLRCILPTLSPVHRYALHLRYAEACSLTQIANRMQVTRERAKGLLTEALRLLRKELRGHTL